MDFVEGAGLAFQNWVENALYFPEALIGPDGELADRVARIPVREQWAVMEMLSQLTGTHTFVARRPERAGLAISFDDRRWDCFIPYRAPGVTRTGPRDYARGSLRFSLSDAEVMFYEAADGTRTIRQILDLPGLAHIARTERDAFGRRFFDTAWKCAHLMIARANALDG
ncbi:MAG: hypothetical protein ACREVG_06740 [Burkholderiales bacterium]